MAVFTAALLAAITACGGGDPTPAEPCAVYPALAPGLAGKPATPCRSTAP